MKRIRRYVAMALTLGMVSSVTGCSMIQRTEESISKTVLAKVGDTKITRGDVDEALKTYLDYYEEQYGEDFESDSSLTETLKSLRTQQLEGLVDQEVLMQSKEDLGVNPTDEEIQEQVDERINYYKEALGSDEDYQSFIESYGYDDESFAEYWETQVVLSMIVDAIIADVSVSDEEIETYYNENIADYTTKASAEVTYLYFEIETDDDGNQVDGAADTAKALAEQARALAVAGTSLETISTTEGYTDSCTYTDAGTLTFEDSGMDDIFTAAFSSLAAGEVSSVVEDTDGYYVIVNTTVQSEDVVQAYDDVKEDISSTLLYDKQEEAYETKLAELKENLNVKLYEDRL